jgi:superfamily II DNA or RNA helicase
VARVETTKGENMIEIKNKLNVRGLSHGLKTEIKRRLTMRNPAFDDAVKMGRNTRDIDETLTYYDETPNGLICPRGFIRDVIELTGAEYIDKGRTFQDIDFHFNGTLRPYQQEAVDAVLCRQYGVLQAPTGSGKTIMGLAVIAARKQPSLIVVHTKELLNQWRDRAAEFLTIAPSEIGQIGGGQFTIGPVTVGIVNTLSKRLDDVNDKFGFVLVDECHRTPGRTFTDVVSAFDCKYLMGLSATPYRRDRLTKVIGFFLGRTVHRIEADKLTQAGALCKATVIFKTTGYRSFLDGSTEYSKLLSELTMDTERNALIAQDVASEAIQDRGAMLVLSDRKDHCETLRNALSVCGIDAAVLTGKTPAKRRAEIVSGLNDGSIKVVCATGQLIGEGFDCKGLSSLFVATPLKFSGRVIQYAGRVLRPGTGKDRARIFDYVDYKVGVLASSSGVRMLTYRQAGFDIESEVA